MECRIMQGMCLIVIGGCASLAGCQSAEKVASLGGQQVPPPSALAIGEADRISPRAHADAPAVPASLAEGADSRPSRSPAREGAGLESVMTASWEGPDPVPDVPALPDKPGDEKSESERSLGLRESSADARLPGGAGGGGSAPPPSGPPMTMDDLWRIAVAANPTLQQAYGLVQQAEGNWLQVGLYPNPAVEWHSEANNAPFDAHFGIIEQEFVTAKKLKLNRGVASSDVARARWEAEAQNLRVLNDVRIRFIAVLGAQREVAVAEELLKIADEGVRVTERFFQAEEVSQADVLQATLQQRHTQILLRNARFRAAAAWRELSNVVGRPDLPPRPLAGNLEDEMPEIDWDAAWQQLLGRSPVLHAARARLAAAEVQVRREQVEPVPNLRVSSGTGIDALPDGESFQMAFLSLGAQIPVWNRNQGNVIAATGNLQAARAEVARLELSLRDELAEAFQRYQSARNEVQTYRDPILPTAERNLQLTQRAYDEGEFDFLRVLIARRDLFQARIDYVESLTELRSSAIEIQGLLLTGGLDPATNNPTPSNSAGQTADQGR